MKSWDQKVYGTGLSLCPDVTEQVHQPPLSAQTHKIKFLGLSVETADVNKSVSESPKKPPICLKFTPEFSAVLSIATDMLILLVASHLVNSVNATQVWLKLIFPNFPESTQTSCFLTSLLFPDLSVVSTMATHSVTHKQELPTYCRKNSILVRN